MYSTCMYLVFTATSIQGVDCTLTLVNVYSMELEDEVELEDPERGGKEEGGTTRLLRFNPGGNSSEHYSCSCLWDEIK